MRVGIAKPRRGAGGGTTMALTIAQGLRARGHEVFLMSHPRAQIRPRARELGFSVEPVLMGRDARWLANVWSWQALVRRRPAVLLTFMARIGDMDFAVPPALRLGIPVVARRGLSGPLDLNARQLRMFERVRWVAVSEAIGREIEEAVPATVSPVVIPNGTDLHRVAATPPAALDLPPGSLAVAFIGRLHEEKGIEELAAAWQQVERTLPNAYLLIAGAGEHEAILRRGLRDAARVRWLGFRSDVAALMKSVDLLVLPTHHEGFPNVIVEAMAAGLPVLSTRVDGPIEVVEDGVTGQLIQPGDPQTLAAELVAMLRDETGRRHMGEAALEAARRRFDHDVMIDFYERVLLDAAGGA